MVSSRSPWRARTRRCPERSTNSDWLRAPWASRRLRRRPASARGTARRRRRARRRRGRRSAHALRGTLRDRPWVTQPQQRTRDCRLARTCAGRPRGWSRILSPRPRARQVDSGMVRAVPRSGSGTPAPRRWLRLPHDRSRAHADPPRAPGRAPAPADPSGRRRCRASTRPACSDASSRGLAAIGLAPADRPPHARRERPAAQASCSSISAGCGSWPASSCRCASTCSRRRSAASCPRCRCAAPASPSMQARVVIEQELGRPLEEVFDEFTPEPFAATWVCQIHRARLRREQVWTAVKVQRPDVAARFARDLAIRRAPGALARAAARRGRRSGGRSARGSCGRSSSRRPTSASRRRRSAA